MLNRIKVRGYKSLHDIEVDLPPLAVLFGPNSAGKSNFLDALQLLSKLATSRTLKEAFEPPYRGKPLESFTIGTDGLRGLLERDALTFSIEVDLYLSQGTVDAVNRQVREMRRPTGAAEDGGQRTPGAVRERSLRYRIEVEMLPKAGGILRVTDEYLAALNAKGEPTAKRKPFVERQDHKIQLRLEGQGHPSYFDLYLDHSILSMPHYPPHYPHLAAARREFESWQFFYFEPRERMRAVNPVKEVRHIGLMGEELAAFLNTLKSAEPARFQGIEKALRTLLPNIDAIETEVSDVGEVELRLREGGVAMPARVLSEGTLRLLGLLSLSGVGESPTLVGFEEPENGVHPGRIQLIAELLRTRESAGQTQYIVTTHSPLLADLLADESLFVVRRETGRTCIEALSCWGPLARRNSIEEALTTDEGSLRTSERILRGDFDT